MSRGAHLLHAVFGTYWAIREDKLMSMLAFLDERLEGQRFTADEIQARIGEARAKRDTSGAAASGVAVLPLYGLVSHRAHMVQDISGPGGTSTELFGRDFDTALSDSKVGTIVLDIDSPGGSVAGVQELADKIYGARGEKRIIAVANSLAASAAYWIGSAAEEFVVTPSGEVGSIGVYAIHTDSSRRDANVGVQRTILKAGRYKAEGAPFEPLNGDARAYAQQQIDEFYGAFIDAVARQRGVSSEVARGASFGEGRTVLARQAVDRKMADRVATLEQVLAELGVGGATGTPMRGSRRAAALDLGLSPVNTSTTAADSATVAAITLRLGTAAEAAAPLVLLPDARQGAPDQQTPSLATTAPQAKEQPVTTTLTPAPGSPGAPDAAAAQAQASLNRQIRIQELCTLAGATMQQYAEFVASDMTPEQVRASLQGARPRPTPVADVQVGADRAAEQRFGSLGEQLVAIVQAGKPGGRRDPRLSAINAAATGMNESVGSEGGFFLQSDLLPGVITPVYQQDPLLSRVKRIPIGAGRTGVKYNVVDETSRANGSRYGGIQAYWAAEADTATAKKPKLRQMALDLKKIIGIGYLTEELMQDAPAAGMLLTDAFRDEVRFMVGASVFNGTGAGQPLGILASGALATQAIEASQTIANSNASIATNTAKMLSRMPAEFWGEAIWLYNPELLPTFVTAVIGSSTVPIFVTGGGMRDGAPDTIWGRPAFASDFCEAVGTPGDILLVAPSQYHLGLRDENAQVSDSVHVRFLYDENTLRITYRVDGAPVWSSAVTPYKGAATRSPFVALATRS